MNPLAQNARVDTGKFFCRMRVSNAQDARIHGMKNQSRTWKVVVLLAFCGGCLLSCRSHSPEAHAKPVAKADPNLDAKLKTWQIAFEEEGSIYLSNGDFKNKKLLAKNASYPTWSPGGRYFAYLQRDKVYVKDYHTNKIYLVCALKKEDVDDYNWKMEFSKTETFLFVPKDGQIWVYDFVNPQYNRAAMSRHELWDEGVPAMSPSGKHLAFVRNGDVWISDQPNGWAYPSILEGGNCYYDDSRRIAPLAHYHDASGGSASTPFLVNDLVWLDEQNIWYHYQRRGGSGVSEVGLITVRETEVGEPSQETTVCKRFASNMVFNPGLCPDNKTLTLVMHDNDEDEDYCLYVVDREVKPVKKFKGISFERYAWRPKGKDIEPNVLPKETS